MKIDTVLVSSNENPDYYKFYPYIKPIWERLLGCRCILVYVTPNTIPNQLSNVTDALPAELKPYANDILIYKSPTNIHTAFIAQTIRLLYPALIEGDKGVLIADVDSIPMCRDYFVKQVENIDDKQFINYSFDPKMFAVKEHNMSYCLATPQVWKEIFKIQSVEDINTRIGEWNKQNGRYHFDPKYRSKCIGFHFDQQILYSYLENWKKDTNRLVLFNLSARTRFTPAEIVRINEPDIQSKVKNGYFEDNIFLRPYHKKKRINDFIARLLLSSYAI